MSSDNKNWFGMSPHTTDSLIHWSLSVREAVNLATSYRSCYERIKTADCLMELNTLMRASYEQGGDDMHEQLADNDL